MKTKYTEDAAKNQLIAERSFNAPKSKVWKYYTTAELLDKWWGPLPYKAITHSFDFQPGGQWRYVMSGPEEVAHYCVNEFHTIDPQDSFTCSDSFADEYWNIKSDMPSTEWEVLFTQDGDVTNLKVVLTLKSAADLETLVKMGMKEGFDTGLTQLEELLKL
ncbi:MAG: SRPBCC domain-containing protein [Patescibacteria group bacterium]